MVRERVEKRDASMTPMPGHELMKRRQEALFGKGKSHERIRVDDARVEYPMDPGKPLGKEAQARRHRRKLAEKSLAAQRNRSTP